MVLKVGGELDGEGVDHVRGPFPEDKLAETGLGEILGQCGISLRSPVALELRFRQAWDRVCQPCWTMDCPETQMDHDV